MESNPTPRRHEEARAFWTGPQLSQYEELSLLSFAATGARVLLYSNDMTLRVPDGIELIDVHEFLPERTYSFSYENGEQCLSPHSDLFRYAAVERFGGWYFDLDVICMRRELPSAKVYIARQDGHLINAAVMKFPAQAPVLTAAIAEARRLWPEAGRLTIGPDLITRLIDEYGLAHLVRPRGSAYEIETVEILAMFDPGAREELEDRVTKSDFVHLWNEIWRRIRIPKNYGPPEGSFIDGLFRKFDIRFTSEARLSYDALESWIRERQILSDADARRGLPSFEPPTSAIVPLKLPQKAAIPQTVRTLWHGDSIGPYQLLSLRSFVDRGHRVEVYSFSPKLTLPRWLSRRDGSDIIDPRRVLRYLPEHERFAIHADLFRYTLLNKLGGWWIDPDAILLTAELPAGDLFVGGIDESATSVMKFPARHPFLVNVLQLIAPYEQSVTDWDRVGAAALADAVASRQFNLIATPDAAGPVSQLDILELFDPAQTDDVTDRCAHRAFLDLHNEVWLGAGIPNYLGPPQGSFLDRLFLQHKTGVHFAEQMDFADVRRWVGHYYECRRLRDGIAKR